MVLTIFMAMGAWRISQARVLTRRTAAIETLGSATVLCTDKTGTLTENRMTISELRTPDGKLLRLPDGSNGAMPAAFGVVVEVGMLASAEIPFDPMERAFHNLAQERVFRWEESNSSDRKLVRTYGLRPDLLAMSNVWRSAAAGSNCQVDGRTPRLGRSARQSCRRPTARQADWFRFRIHGPRRAGRSSTTRRSGCRE